MAAEVIGELRRAEITVGWVRGERLLDDVGETRGNRGEWPRSCLVRVIFAWVAPFLSDSCTIPIKTGLDFWGRPDFVGVLPDCSSLHPH